MLLFLNLIFTRYVIFSDDEILTQAIQRDNNDILKQHIQRNEEYPISNDDRFKNVDQMIKNNDIFIITRELCGWSKKMREHLKSKNAEFKELEISKEEKERFLEKAGMKGKTFPIVFFKGKYIGGYTDSEKSKEFNEFLNK